MSRSSIAGCAVLSLVALASCARVGVTPTTPSAKPRVAGAAASPGFDKRDFPTAREMQIWYATSPYEWVGYYLPSPCFAGTPWTGHRQELVSQGWGLAVLYVGLQARSGSPSTTAATAQATRCSQSSPSAAQGTIDADDAANVAQSDGFAPGTTIFLDVERADTIPAELDAYARAWMTRLLARGFTPGVYAHRLNANAMFETQKSVYTAAGDTRTPPFWVSSSTGFDLSKSPAESGFQFATVWQSPSDTTETYGGVRFRVDGNVRRRN